MFMFELFISKKLENVIINMLMRIYAVSKCRVEINGYLSRLIELHSGIKQGCSLSIIIFPIIMDYMLTLIEQIEPFAANAHADDTAAALSTIANLYKTLSTIDHFGKKSDLLLSKPKSMILKTKQINQKHIQGIPVVKQVPYLGITLSNKGVVNTLASTIENMIKILENAKSRFLYFNRKVMILNSYALAQLQYKVQLTKPTATQSKQIHNISTWFLLYSKEESKYDPNRKYFPYIAMDRFKQRRYKGGYGLIDMNTAFHVNCIKHVSRFQYDKYKNKELFVRDVILLSVVAERSINPLMILNQNGRHTGNQFIINYYNAIKALKWRVEYRPEEGEKVWILRKDYTLSKQKTVVKVEEDLHAIEFDDCIYNNDIQVCYGNDPSKLVLINDKRCIVPFNEPSSFKKLISVKVDKLRFDTNIGGNILKLRKRLANHLEAFAFKLFNRCLSVKIDKCQYCSHESYGLRNHFYQCSGLQNEIDKVIEYDKTLLRAAVEQTDVTDIIVLQIAWRMFTGYEISPIEAIKTSIKKQNVVNKINKTHSVQYEEKGNLIRLMH